MNAHTKIDPNLFVEETCEFCGKTMNVIYTSDEKSSFIIGHDCEIPPPMSYENAIASFFHNRMPTEST